MIQRAAEAPTLTLRGMIANRISRSSLIIAEAALTEAPRFDLYELYELRALETLDGLERVWSRASAAAPA